MSREIMQQALDALKQTFQFQQTRDVIAALEAALAQPEPVQVRPHEFIAMASKQANMIGKPVVWAEYPTPHKIILDEGWEWGHEARAKEALAQPEQEPDAWRNAAIRLGEDLYSVGPDGYYDMTAKQWLDWALSVVNTAPPKREWVGLTEEEIATIFFHFANKGVVELTRVIEANFKRKNNAV